MNSSTDTAAFDAVMSQALVHPEVVKYLAEVRSSFRFEWQLRILPLSAYPANFKAPDRSVTAVTPGLIFLKAKIYLAAPDKIPLYAVLLHELAHVAQAIAGYSPGNPETPFGEHDADVRVTKISTYPIIDVKSDIMLEALFENYEWASPFLKIRDFLYATNANRSKLMRLLQKDKDPVIVQFLASEWVSHGRYVLWDVKDLAAASAQYRTWL